MDRKSNNLHTSRFEPPSGNLHANFPDVKLLFILRNLFSDSYKKIRHENCILMTDVGFGPKKFVNVNHLTLWRGKL